MTDHIVINETGGGEGRFSRFELISWWDQARLAAARVLVIGAGALGNEIIKNLALLGVGHILVVDMDTVEDSNLSRSCLFRERDNGRLKAEAACEAAVDLYPGLRARPISVNAVHDLGAGAYHWADIIIGGLDNREARVSINSFARRLRKPWIDGAIEVLNGVARVFLPDHGSCYECTMNAADWKMLEARRSCALLTRDEILEGRTPTTPTTAGIIAAMQVQEAVKLLHGLDTLAGQGIVYNGLTNDTYTVTYPEKPDCFAHETWPEPERTGRGAEDMRVGDLLAQGREQMGGDAVIDLSRDIIQGLSCPACGRQTTVLRSLGQVSESEGRCPDCGAMRVPDLVCTIDAEFEFQDYSLRQCGIPLWDIVMLRAGSETQALLLDGDEEAIAGPAAAG